MLFLRYHLDDLIDGSVSSIIVPLTVCGSYYVPNSNVHLCLIVNGVDEPLSHITIV